MWEPISSCLGRDIEVSQFEVEVRLESPGGSTVDKMDSLKQEVEAEVQATTDAEGVSSGGKNESPPPEGAQGLPELTQWFLGVAASDPQALLYGLSLALRQILDHYKSSNDNPDDKQDNVTVKIVINAQTINLSGEGSKIREQIEDAVKRAQSPDN